MSSPASKSRRQFIKYGLAGAVGIGIASAIEIPFLGNALINQNTTLANQNEQIDQMQAQANQVPTLQTQALAAEAIRTLSQSEVREIEALAETIIPSDENGPGAKEAGVLFFIDQQLASDYGNNARWYKKGPFVPAGHSGPLVVQGITYPEGTMQLPFGGPTYQYDILMREFWRSGLQSLQEYSQTTYNAKVEDLTDDQRTALLIDLYNSKPTNFKIKPQDVFFELIFMVYSGFFMDPSYGGNKGMVGWKLTGFVGTNMGNAYNEGLNVQNLMVATTPTRLQPASVGQYQRGLGLIGGPT
jgi:gluconate 2-dehydrogenase gamma chain